MINNDEAVTVLVEEENMIYQLIGVISDSSDDSIDNLPFIHRAMPRTKQTGRKIPGLAPRQFAPDSSSSESSESDPDEPPFTDPSWTPKKRSPARSRSAYTPSPRKHGNTRGRGGRRGGRRGPRNPRPPRAPRPAPAPAPVPPVPVPAPVPVPPAPIPGALPQDPPEPDDPLRADPPELGADPPELGADPPDPEPQKKPDPNQPPSTGSTPVRPGTPKGPRVPTPPPLPRIRTPTPERRPDPDAPPSTGSTPIRPGTPKRPRVPTPPPLPPIRTPTPEPREPTPPRQRVPTPPPVPPIRTPTPEPNPPDGATPVAGGSKVASDSDGDPQPTGGRRSRRRVSSSSSDENPATATNQAPPAKKPKPDPSLRPPLITPSRGDPRPKRTPLSELKGFARESRLRERRRLRTAYTSKRGYFKLPPGETMRPLKRVRMEVRHYQTSQEILIPPLPFARFVREILRDVADDMYNPQYGTLPLGEQTYFRICPEAIFALQEAAEAYMIGFFTIVNLLAIHAKRVAIMPKDLELAKIVRGSEHVGGAMTETGGKIGKRSHRFSYIDYPYKADVFRVPTRRWHNATRKMSLPRKFKIGSKRPKKFRPKETMASVTPGVCMRRVTW